MQVIVKDVNLSNLWKESFTRQETGEIVEFYRALLNKSGEAPAQVGVGREQAESLVAYVGDTGTALLNVDARPGQRVRVHLVGFEL